MLLWTDIIDTFAKFHHSIRQSLGITPRKNWTTNENWFITNKCGITLKSHEYLYAYLLPNCSLNQWKVRIHFWWFRGIPTIISLQLWEKGPNFTKTVDSYKCTCGQIIDNLIVRAVQQQALYETMYFVLQKASCSPYLISICKCFSYTCTSVHTSGLTLCYTLHSAA